MPENNVQFLWILGQVWDDFGVIFRRFLLILGNKNKMMSWKVPITLQMAKKTVSRGNSTLWVWTGRAIFWPSWPWWGVGGCNKQPKHSLSNTPNGPMARRIYYYYDSS